MSWDWILIEFIRNALGLDLVIQIVKKMLLFLTLQRVCYISCKSVVLTHAQNVLIGICVRRASCCRRTCVRLCCPLGVSSFLFAFVFQAISTRKDGVVVVASSEDEFGEEEGEGDDEDEEIPLEAMSLARKRATMTYVAHRRELMRLFRNPYDDDSYDGSGP
jgi:hypothetical protein